MKKLLFFLLLLPCVAFSGKNQWYNLENHDLNTYLFMTDTCEFCHKAQQFLLTKTKENPWLKVNFKVINKDLGAMKDFSKMKNQVTKDDMGYSVPSYFFCGVRWVGFDNNTQKLWEALKYCHTNVQRDKTLTTNTVNVLQRWRNSIFETTEPNLSAAHFILGTALLDALNPCAGFSLFFLIAVLLIFPENKRKILFGAVIILAYAIMHYIQQAQIPLFINTITLMRFPAIVIGGALIFYCIGALVNYVVIEFISVALFFTAASLVFLYQQTCITKNFALFFQQWLLEQGSNALIYQITYQILYLIPLSLIVIFVSYFSRRIKNPLKYKLAGNLFIMTISLLLMFKPSLLSSLKFSTIIFMLVTVLTILLNYFYKKKKIAK